MRQIDTTEAVGHILAHDMTQIIPGKTKDARFRKGHKVTQEDIPVLLSMGKEHLYVWESVPGMIHEDDAAQRLRVICQNNYMHATPVKEGKIELVADRDGLFRVDVTRLDAVNEIEQVMIAARHTNTPVKAGMKLAGTRVIPLMIKETLLEAAECAAGDKPLLELIPYKLKTAGMVVTGSEVSKGLVEDAFSPVIKKKLQEYGIETRQCVYPGDDRGQITREILRMEEEGLDMVLCTGGMSVDPDDRTPGAVKDTGARIITYGAPVLPGAMFLLGYLQSKIPVIGLPGCAMYAKATVFDLVLPRVAADITLEKRDFVQMGHGGLCLSCPECTYPVCPFGKG